MLEGRFRSEFERFWHRMARPLAAAGVTPNQITAYGTLAVVVHCALFLWHSNVVVLGAGIALLELTDYLDGAVARITGACTPRGAWFDATSDRYKDLAFIAVMAASLDAWPAGFVAVTGSHLTSYIKARAEADTDERWLWPDLFERLERVAVLVAGCVLPGIWADATWAPLAALWIVGVGAHLSALQRGVRAWKRLGGAQPNGVEGDDD